MDDVEESEEDIEEDHLEGLIDDEPNLYETSAVEGTSVLL